MDHSSTNTVEVQRTTVRSSAAGTRGRQKRLGKGGRRKEIGKTDGLKLAWRNQDQPVGHRRKFHFENWRDGLGFLLGFFTGSDGFAQRTGMPAIEGLSNGGSDRLLAEIAGQHGGPSHGLQRGPVQARRQYEGDHHQDFSAAQEHAGKIIRPEQTASGIYLQRREAWS